MSERACRRRRTRSILVLILAACGAVAIGGERVRANSSGTDAPVASVEGERLVVQLVEVDLWAEDRDGRPVHDLRQEEIVLREDGRAIAIEQFEARGAPTPGSAVATPSVPGSVQAAAASPGAAPTTVAIFFDDVHLDPGRRNRVAKEIAAWLDRELEPDTYALVVLHDRSSALAVPRTRDHDLVRSTLERLALHRASAVVRDMEEQRTLQQIRDRQRHELELRDLISAPCPQDLVTLADNFADQVAAEARGALAALAEFAASLGALPGRKLVLYVSDGLPIRPGAAAYDLVRTLCDGSGYRDRIQYAIDVNLEERKPGQLDGAALALAGEGRSLAGAVDDVVNRANARGVTIWTLHALGIRSAGTDARQETRSTLARDEFRQRAEVEDALSAFASGTGGESVFGRNDFGKALEALSDDLVSGYTLAYSSPRAGDGRVHSIAVETTRPGVRLRHRRSWRDAPFEEDLTALVEGAARYGVDRPGLGARLESFERANAAGETRTVVRLALPETSVTFLPGANGAAQGSLRLALSLRDGDGGWTAVRGRVWPVERAPATAAGAARALVRDVELPAAEGGARSIVVGVRDELSGELAVLRLELAARN